MSRTYTPTTIFRMAEIAFVKKLFEAFDAKVDLIDWKQMTNTTIGLLLKLKKLMPMENSNRLEATMRKIFTIACPEGMRVVADAFGSALPDDYCELVRTHANPYTIAILVAIRYPSVLQNALTLMKMYQSTWSNRLIRLPKAVPSTTPDTIKLIETDIEDICANYRETGTVCTVEHFEKDGVYYYYAWPDDYSEDILVHNDDRELVHKTVRKTFAIAFSYDSVNGVCQLASRGSKEMKEELQDMFLIDVLGALPKGRELAPYNLSLFLHPNFTLGPEPDENVTIRVTAIKLSQNGKSNVAVNPQAGEPLWSELKRCVNAEYMASDNIRVDEVALSFVFRGADDRRIKSVSFALRPFQCTLKDESDPYSQKIAGYLKKRRIANDECHTKAAKSLQFN